jgi:hypothetical protein
VNLETRIVTPTSITPPITRLCRGLSLDAVPGYVSVEPIEDGKVNECFGNVALKVERSGGGIQHGWCIAEWPGAFIEAEFHAVWRSPDDSLLDVTPRAHGETNILFLPDFRRTFNDAQRDNVRVPLRKDALVQDLIGLAVKRFTVMNRGNRQGTFGEISMDPQEIMPILQAWMFVEIMLRDGKTAESPCACNSGRKYKNCHGPLIRGL